MDERTTEAIWRACGAAGPLRIGVTPPRPGEVRSVPQPFAVIGRDSRCEIELDDDAVSRRHALLVVLEGRTFGIDLGSREGTFWGGTPRVHGLLEGNTTMKVGPYQIQVLRPKAPNPAAAAEPINPMAIWPRGRKNTTDLVLEVVNPQSRKVRWRIKSFVTLVGRSPDCKLKLLDSSVSSVHCCLICTPMGLWVIDLLGRDGIEVNERPVRFARLADSDDLRVGRFQFRIRGELSLPEAEGAGAGAGAGAGSSSDPGAMPNATALARRNGNETGAEILGVAGLPAVNGPSSRSFELSARGTEPADSVLVPVVNALRILQQQDQDQHHQTLMMLQTIFAMHGEQISTVRSQLDYVLQLLQESKTLTMDPALAARIAEVAKSRELTGPPLFPSGPGAGAGSGSGAGKRGESPVVPEKPSRIYQLPGAKKAAAKGPGPVAPTPGSRPEGAPPRSVPSPKPVTIPQGAPPAGSMTGSSDPISTTTTKATTLNQAEAGRNKEGGATIDPSANPEHSLFEDGMHSMIRDRLHDIRRERMSLWQKIIDMVGGG